MSAMREAKVVAAVVLLYKDSFGLRTSSLFSFIFFFILAISHLTNATKTQGSVKTKVVDMWKTKKKKEKIFDWRCLSNNKSDSPV